MQQSILTGKKIMRQGLTSKNSVSTLFLRREIFMRHGIPFAHFIRQSEGRGEVFHTPRHFPIQVPPRGEMLAKGLSENQKSLFDSGS